MGEESTVCTALGLSLNPTHTHRATLPNSKPPSPVSLDLFPNLLSMPKKGKRKTTTPSSQNNSCGSSITEENGGASSVPKRQRCCAKEAATAPRRWIEKRLTKSDANASSRLLLSKEDIMNRYVLPYLDDEAYGACHGTDGLRVKMWDLDTASEHQLTLKQWGSGSYVLTSNWSADFVQRRGLKEGDFIHLLWDSLKHGFYFHKSPAL